MAPVRLLATSGRPWLEEGGAASTGGAAAGLLVGDRGGLVRSDNGTSGRLWLEEGGAASTGGAAPGLLVGDRGGLVRSDNGTGATGGIGNRGGLVASGSGAGGGSGNRGGLVRSENGGGAGNAICGFSNRGEPWRSANAGTLGGGKCGGFVRSLNGPGAAPRSAPIVEAFRSKGTGAWGGLGSATDAGGSTFTDEGVGSEAVIFTPGGKPACWRGGLVGAECAATAAPAAGAAATCGRPPELVGPWWLASGNATPGSGLADVSTRERSGAARPWS